MNERVTCAVCGKPLRECWCFTDLPADHKADPAPSVPPSVAEFRLAGGMANNPELEALLKKAAGHVMTPREKIAQRASWLRGTLGMMKSGENLTREELEARVIAADPAYALLKELEAKEAEIARLSKQGVADEVSAVLEAYCRLVEPRPLSEYHEEMGDVLWWKFPLSEAPYCGSPLDLGYSVEFEIRTNYNTETVSKSFGGWPGYHTHWTPLPKVKTPC